MFATLPTARLLRTIQLKKLAFVTRRLLDENLPTAARLAGLQLNPLQPMCTLGSVGVVTLGLLWLFGTGPHSTGPALICFVAALALRFGFLFASFVPDGVAVRLERRFGVERGHAIYGMALDAVLFLQRVAFIALTCATAREPSGFIGHALQVLGVPMLALGVGVTIWAARTVGHDAYHYRDLFTGSRNVSIEDSGPYALCPHPMYALGPLAAYGIAMLALSPIALLAAGVNQALLFAFTKAVEQPRLQRANFIFVETQRRYELARTLLGFDPRQELARLRHADAHHPGSADAAAE